MGNRIPRKFSVIAAEILVDSSAYPMGTSVQIWKDEFGYHSKAIRGDTVFAESISHIRNENYYRIITIT